MPAQIRTLVLILFVVLLPSTTIAGPRLRGMNVAPGLTESDIEDLAALGPNVVRYQLYGAADDDNEDEWFAWLFAKLDELDRLLPHFESHSIKVIVDLHFPPGGYESREVPAQHRLFSERWCQRAFQRAWVMIAQRYRNSRGVFGYELASEPSQRFVAPGLADWNQLAARTAEMVRAIDGSRPIIIHPPYGNPDRLNRLKPIDVSNTIYTFNWYHPKSFAAQGLDGRKTGLTYPTQRNNVRTLRAKLKPVIRFQKKHRVQMYVGEFSVVRWAPGSSGAAYLRDSISLFEARRWHWTYQIFREADVWSVEHGGEPSERARSSQPTERLQVLLSFFARNQR
jgi:endoglucanase